MLYDCQCQQLSTFVTKRQEVNITEKVLIQSSTMSKQHKVNNKGPKMTFVKTIQPLD